MSAKTPSSVKDRLQSLLAQWAVQSGKLLQDGARGALNYSRRLISLLVRPDDMIPHLGNEGHWGFSIGLYLVFILVMYLLDPLLLRMLELDDAAPALFGVWVFFPMFSLLFTWAGLRVFYRLNVPLIQVSNVVAIPLFPLMVGWFVSTAFLWLSGPIGQALMVFSLLLAFIFYAESMRLIFSLERLRRIYFAPMVVAASCLFSGLVLWLILQWYNGLQASVSPL